MGVNKKSLRCLMGENEGIISILSNNNTHIILTVDNIRILTGKVKKKNYTIYIKGIKHIRRKEQSDTSRIIKESILPIITLVVPILLLMACINIFIQQEFNEYALLGILLLPSLIAVCSCIIGISGFSEIDRKIKKGKYLYSTLEIIDDRSLINIGCKGIDKDEIKEFLSELNKIVKATPVEKERLREQANSTENKLYRTLGMFI